VAAIELAARRPQACVDHLTSRIGDASVVTRPLLWAALAIARSRLGASPAALDDAHRALHDARESGLAFGVGVARAAYAQVLLAAGERPGIAASEAQESVRCLLAAEAPVDAALAQVVLAECLAEAGDLASARTQLGQAKAAFAAAGAHWLASNATRAEARLGARAARPHRGGALGLTALSERELEIAQLAASGLTNREIAARLYLSAKTVEAHLGRIFGKLGVRSRVDVASLISAQPS
jgi:DNA-binding NarL/FixJ family response regulator